MERVVFFKIDFFFLMAHFLNFNSIKSSLNMENKSLKNFIPRNISGLKSRTQVSLKTDNIKNAKSLFEIAKLRMLNVNYWHDMAGILSAVYQLTDCVGNIILKYAEEGNFIRVDIPRAVTQEQESFNWIEIELIREVKNEIEDSELFILQLKPFSKSIKNDDKNFSIKNIILERKQYIVSVYEQKINSDSKFNSNNFLNKIKNVMIENDRKVDLNGLNWNILFESWLS